MSIIIGEFVNSDNDIQSNLKEDIITEGVLVKEKPKVIDDLYKRIKVLITMKSDDIDDAKDVVDAAKDTLKGKDFSGQEKKLIYNVCKKAGFSIDGYTKATTNIKGVQVSNHHNVIGRYKDYILTIRFIGVKSEVKVQPMGIKINYDKKECGIPKNVVFDVISNILPSISNVRSSKDSITISAFTDSIDSGYPRISHKYSNKYKVKKGLSGSITISKLKSIKEDSAIAGALPRNDYNPNSAYIVNYTKKNTFDSDLAICKDKMSNIFVCDNGKPMHVSLTDFKDMCSEVSVYECLYESSFDNIVKLSKTGLDFYKNMVDDETVTLESLSTDYRFNKVVSFLDELNSIEECIISSAPKCTIINEVYCPIIPLVNLNNDESNVHYFRDIDGVYAQNIDTLIRSSSYNKVNDIPQSTINLLQNM